MIHITAVSGNLKKQAKGLIALRTPHPTKWTALIVCLLIPLGIGALSGFLTKDSMSIYQTLNQPPLSPPGIVFPIVWTLLYLLMGVSCYLIYTAKAPDKAAAFILYGAQLVVNFLWSIFFFNLGWHLFSFLWLMFLWLLILMMIIKFYPIDKRAALLQIPYLLWVTFAGYLNFGVWLLNR